MPDSRGRCSSPFPSRGSQRLSTDSLRGHVAGMTKHRSARNAVTCPPKWYLFIYLHLHAFELQGWQELGRSTGAHPVCRFEPATFRSTSPAAQRFKPLHHLQSQNNTTSKIKTYKIKHTIRMFISTVLLNTRTKDKFY